MDVDKDLGLAWDQLFLRPKDYQPQSPWALSDWSVPWPGSPLLTFPGSEHPEGRNTPWRMSQSSEAPRRRTFYNPRTESAAPPAGGRGCPRSWLAEGG